MKRQIVSLVDDLKSSTRPYVSSVCLSVCLSVYPSVSVCVSVYVW